MTKKLRDHLWYLKNKKRILKKQKKYLKKKHTQKLRKISLAKWKIEHSKEWNKYLRQYYIKNKKRIDKINKGWRKRNPEKARRYEKQKQATDIQYKIRHILRNRFNVAFYSHYKGGSAVRNLGCPISFLRDYLEKKFYRRMTWNNYGIYWEIDHIIPLMSFDLLNKHQFKQAVHYTNLQPLTIEDHKKKTVLDKRMWKDRK